MVEKNNNIILICASVVLALVVLAILMRCSLSCDYAQKDSYIGAMRGTSDYDLGRKAYGQVEPYGQAMDVTDSQF